MTDLWQDVRYAFRSLMKSPGFTVVVLLTLTLGIGATVAMFSVLDASLRRALPYAEADRLVLGRATWNGNLNPMASFPDYMDYRDQNQSFESLAAIVGFVQNAVSTGGGEPEEIAFSLVTGEFFPTLGVTPQVGRTFSPDESSPGGPNVIVLSNGFWQRRFGGSADALGQTVTLDGNTFQVVGVMPPGFHFLYDVDAWVAGADGGPYTGVRRYHNWLMLGRLKPGVEVEEAQVEMDVISSQLAQAYPESNENKALQVDLLQEALVEGFRTSLLLLMGAIVLVLLIACGNVAGLLLARGSARASEMAVRSALGAHRSRLVRQLLTESVLLALGAGVLGILMATWLQDLILGFASVDTLGLREVGASGTMLSFALILSMGTALLFGVAPSLASTRGNPAEELKEGGRGSGGGGGQRFRSGLVAVQVALSVILLIGSGLLMKSFIRLRGVEPGFQTENVLAAGLRIPSQGYDDPLARLQFYDQLVEGLRALPGVEAVGLSDRLPIRDPGNNVGVWDPEHPPSGPTDTQYAYQRTVYPGYFEAMGIPVVAGRDFQDADRDATTPIIILNQATADSLFPGQAVVGRQVAVDLGGDQPVVFEVIGVVGNHHMSSLGSQIRPSMFYSYHQRAFYGMQVAVRTRGSPRSQVRAVQEVVTGLNPDIPLRKVQTMEEVLAASVTDLRSITAVLGMFSFTALFLAALGLYGVLAYWVTRRSHEIGVRVALGASAREVLKLILARGMTLVVVGLVLGVAGAFGATRLLEDLLFQTEATDPLAFMGVSGFFILVALAACLLPAWRAVRVDPVEAFRAE